MKKLAVVLVILSCLFSIALAQDESRVMEIKDLFGFKYLSSPELSPDGSQVLFTLTESDMEENGYLTHIWRVNADGSDLVQMTQGDKSCFSPKWSVDGKKIFFATGRNEKNQVWMMYNNGGEARELTSHDTSVRSFEISEDGKAIFFLAPEDKTEEDKKREEDKNSVNVIDHNLKNIHLWKFDLETNEESRVTEGDYSIRDFALSPDGDKIAFTAAPSPDLDKALEVEVYLFDLTDKSRKRLTDNRINEGDISWKPSGDVLTFVSDSSADLNTYYQNSIFSLSLEGGTPVDMLPDFEEEVYYAHRWIEVNGKEMILFAANTGVTTQYYLYDYENQKIQSQLTNWKGQSGRYDYKAGKFVYIYDDPVTPNDLYIKDSFDSKAIKLTNSNPHITDFKLAQYKTITWKASDGYEAEGILILPPDYEEGKKYPTLVQLHGGPESSYKLSFSTSWSTYPHVLAGMGYVLFQPNYRGSTGYGDDVMRAIIGRYFEDDIDDILTGLDYLIDQGYTDPEKVGAMGWSAGGHLTNWLIVNHSDRIKAGASGAGGANWFSFYAQTDMHYIREIWFTGTPYDKHELFRAKSPINYVKNAKSPMIIFCGEADRRVPAPQSWEMYIGLRRNGVKTQFRLYPGEPHGLRKISHRIDKMEAEVKWFSEHLLGIVPVEEPEEKEAEEMKDPD